MEKDLMKTCIIIKILSLVVLLTFNTAMGSTKTINSSWTNENSTENINFSITTFQFNHFFDLKITKPRTNEVVDACVIIFHGSLIKGRIKQTCKNPDNDFIGQYEINEDNILELCPDDNSDCEEYY